jgi:hypothetical protein
MSENVPKLWSDFDGTAVKKYSARNPRNWSKYPLPGIDGYSDFLQGVKNTGVEFGGVVTIRKELVRSGATNRSIKKLGYRSLIGPDSVVYAGNETNKGKFVAEKSIETTVGMIDDKPHKLGKFILGALIDSVQQPETQHNPIVLGVVAHEKSLEYIDRLAGYITELPSGIITLEEQTNTGFIVKADRFSLQVTPLQPYTEQAGEAFGQLLVDQTRNI